MPTEPNDMMHLRTDSSDVSFCRLRQRLIAESVLVAGCSCPDYAGKDRFSFSRCDKVTDDRHRNQRLGVHSDGRTNEAKITNKQGFVVSADRSVGAPGRDHFPV
jgi:hypothetical protein